MYPLTGTGSQAASLTIFPNFSTAFRNATVTVGGLSYSVSQAAATGNFNQRFVGQIYFNILGRIPSAPEVQFQVSALDSGLSRADLFMNFYNSLEFNNGGRFVSGLYVGLLDRDAEYGGWLFQRNALATSVVSQSNLVTNFLGAAEYSLKFGSPTLSEFVRLLYRYVLLREASEAEVTFQAANGGTRLQLATNFLQSAEFRTGRGLD